MYPLKFENLYYRKIWGGRDLNLFRNNIPEGNIGESWDVACHENGMSIIKNGKFKGVSLEELIKKEKKNILGTKIKSTKFPLLIKLINAKENLSIQVHPNNKYAKKFENDLGKTEVWYVVEAFKNANLVVGTKENLTKDQFKSSIKSGDVEKYLNRIPVKKGEVYLVKSGLIHAIGEGVIIAEIQQNSDITYRVYDYNRGRELHIKKALDVMDLKLKGRKYEGIEIKREGYTKKYLCLGKEFSLELYDIKTFLDENSDRERFFVFTCVEGKGTILYDNGTEEINMGDSIFIPANLGKYKIEGKIKLLKSYVPDVEKVERCILDEIEY